MIDSKMLKSAGKASISIFNLIITTAGKSEEIVENLGDAAVHGSAMLNDLATDGHDATTQARLFNKKSRKLRYEKKYKKEQLEPLEEEPTKLDKAS